MIAETLILNQINRITFVMVDASYTEKPGLGGVGLTLEVSKNGGVFNPSTGVKAEISDGWYRYDLPAAECDTVGPLSIIVNAAGCVQQNLLFVVQQYNYGCIPFTYTVINGMTLLPEEGVEVWFSTDTNDPPLNVVWCGDTDTFGIARDDNGDLPCLDAGTYYVWAQKAGFTPSAWPDTEIVS